MGQNLAQLQSGQTGGCFGYQEVYATFSDAPANEIHSVQGADCISHQLCWALDSELIHHFLYPGLEDHHGCQQSPNFPHLH